MFDYKSYLQYHKILRRYNISNLKRNVLSTTKMDDLI